MIGSLNEFLFVDEARQLFDSARSSPWPTLFVSLFTILGGLLLRAFVQRRVRSASQQLAWYAGDLNRHFIEQYQRAVALRNDIPAPMQQVFDFALKHAMQLERRVTKLYPLFARSALVTVAIGALTTSSVFVGGAFRAWSFFAALGVLAWQLHAFRETSKHR